MIIVYVLAALLAFSVLIVGHELGHFCLAKLNGVKVEEFSIGIFGPKLLSFNGKETEYSIRAGLIGGCVRMYGEDGEEGNGDSRSFSGKTPLQKLSIIAAGPLMNVVLAIILFSIVSRGLGYITTTINKVENNSPAMIAGLQQGDKILKLNNEDIGSWNEFLEKMSKVENGNESLNLEVQREEKNLSFDIKPKKQENRYIIGISPSVVKPNFIQSVKNGFTQTWDTTKQTFSFFKTIFKGEMKKDDVGGPITMMRLAVKTASQGVIYLTYFMALISVQLAIFNIIPFPALDGGWIFILLIQLITGKKMSDEKIGTINYIGLIVLISLMILILLKDIISPIKL